MVLVPAGKVTRVLGFFALQSPKNLTLWVRKEQDDYELLMTLTKCGDMAYLTRKQTNILRRAMLEKQRDTSLNIDGQEGRPSIQGYHCKDPGLFGRQHHQKIHSRTNIIPDEASDREVPRLSPIAKWIDISLVSLALQGGNCRGSKKWLAPLSHIANLDPWESARWSLHISRKPHRL
eukprot:1423185-Amphidinium_carterae.1